MVNKTKSAFTLAEVLITLVIIGIVVALTIPAAINKYKDEELKAQFKKTYSTISQAIYKTEMNNFYGYARCYYIMATNSWSSRNEDCVAFFDTLAKNLSVQKICKGNAKSGGCIPDYDSYSEETGGFTGFQRNYVENVDHAYVLADGQILIAYFYSNTGSMPLFLMDINGHKGPNTYGKDLYAFRIDKTENSGLYMSGGTNGGFTVPQDGKSSAAMLKYAILGKK